MNLSVKGFRFLWIMLLTVGVFTACSNRNEPEEGMSIAEAPKYDDNGVLISERSRINIGILQSPDSLDPSYAGDNFSWAFTTQIHEPLIAYDGENKEYIPIIAENFILNKDCTEVEFTIREDVYFHNGERLKVEDVQYSLMRALLSDAAAPVAGAIETVEILDQKRIKVVLKDSYAPVLEVLSMPFFGIMHQETTQEYDLLGADIGRMPSVGTGPYKMVAWEIGEYMQFESFDQYHAVQPIIKEVAVTYIDSAKTAIGMLEEGTLDYFYNFTSEDYEEIKNADNISITEYHKDTSLYDITFNTTKEPFDLALVRQAIAYGIDREAFIKDGQDINGSLLHCYTASASFGYDEDAFWYEQDIEKAQALLAQAGFTEGLKVTITQDEDFLSLGEILKEQLSAMGIEAEIESMPANQWMRQVTAERDFDLSLRKTDQLIQDADYILTRRLHSANIGGGNNYAGYANEALDELIDKARIENNTEKRLQLYHQTFEIIKEDVPVIPIFSVHHYYAANKDLRGILPERPGVFSWQNLYFVD